MSGAGFDVAIYEAWSKGMPPDPERAAREFVGLYKTTPRVGLTIGGFDTDPRELFDIPEAMTFLRALMIEIPRHFAGGVPPDDFFDHIIEESRAMLMLAAGVIRRDQINVQTWDEWQADMAQRIKEGRDPLG